MRIALQFSHYLTIAINPIAQLLILSQGNPERFESDKPPCSNQYSPTSCGFYSAPRADILMIIFQYLMKYSPQIHSELVTVHEMGFSNITRNTSRDFTASSLHFKATRNIWMFSTLFDPKQC